MSIDHSALIRIREKLTTLEEIYSGLPSDNSDFQSGIRQGYMQALMVLKGLIQKELNREIY